MAVTVNFTLVQSVVIKADVTDGPNSGYYDALSFFAPQDFPANTPAQILAALGKTQADIKQLFSDRFTAWKAAAAAAAASRPTEADLQALLATLDANQDQIVDRLTSAADKVAYLQAAQVRIAAKLAQLT